MSAQAVVPGEVFEAHFEIELRACSRQAHPDSHWHPDGDRGAAAAIAGELARNAVAEVDLERGSKGTVLDHADAGRTLRLIDQGAGLHR